MAKIDIVKYRQFDKLNIETKEHEKSLPPNYNQQLGDVFLVGYKVDAVSEDGTDEPEVKVLLSDILTAAGGGSGDTFDYNNLGVVIDTEEDQKKLFLTYDGVKFGEGCPIPEGGQSDTYDVGDKSIDYEFYGLKYPIDTAIRTYMLSNEAFIEYNRSNGFGNMVKVKTTQYLTKNGHNLENAIKIVSWIYMPPTITYGLRIQGNTLSILQNAGESSVTIPSGGGSVDTYRLNVTEDNKIQLYKNDDVQDEFDLPEGDPDVTPGEVINNYIIPTLSSVVVNTHLSTTDPTSTGRFAEDEEAVEENTYRLVLDLATVKGDTGEPGPQGAPGQDGKDGTSVKILENQTVCVDYGDGFLGDGAVTVVTSDGEVTTIDGHLYVLSDVTNRIFKDVGEIKGPKGNDGKSVVFDAEQSGNNQIVTRLYTEGEDPTQNSIECYISTNTEAGQKSVQYEVMKVVNGGKRRIANAVVPVIDGEQGPQGPKGADGKSVDSLSLRAAQQENTYNLYSTTDGVESLVGSFTLPIGPVDVDHNIQCEYVEITTDIYGLSIMNDGRYLTWVAIDDGVETLAFDYSRWHDGHDDYIVIDNRSNTKDLTFTMRSMMFGTSVPQGARISKPDPFVVLAGKSVELSVKILERGQTCSCSVMQQGPQGEAGQDGQDGTVFDLYRVRIKPTYFNEETPYETKPEDNPKDMLLVELEGGNYVLTKDTVPVQGKQYYTNFISSSEVNGLNILVEGDTKLRMAIAKYDVAEEEWKDLNELETYADLVDQYEVLRGILNEAASANGGHIIDVCPDTENPYNIAVNMQYGIYGHLHKHNDTEAAGWNSMAEILRLFCCTPITPEDQIPYIAFTIKVYKNIQ